MEQINQREIPNFYDLENTIKNDGKLDMARLTQFLTTKGNLEDKVRLLCICALCRDKDGIPAGPASHVVVAPGGGRLHAVCGDAPRRREGGRGGVAEGVRVHQIVPYHEERVGAQSDQ